MAAITTRLHHPSPPALRRGRPPSYPFLCFASWRPILHRSHAAAIPPMAPVAARRNEDDDDALPNPEHRRSPLGLSMPLVAAVTVAASPRAALALSGGSCGGYDDSSSSSSSSASSSWSSCDDSTTDFIYWSSGDSTTKPEKKEGAAANHESVGTAPAPPMSPSDVWFWGGIAVAFTVMVVVVAAKNGWIPTQQTTSVVKLQVAVRGREMVKSVQKDLNAMAERVQASNRLWYKFILNETMYTLRRNHYFCISSSLSVVAKAGDDSWKWHFERISAQERSKFDEETLSNWNGIKRKKPYSMKTDGSKNEYIVVTVLIAANGSMNLPKAIRSSAELDAVAASLSSTPESNLRGIRVLWTPQDADDVLSEERMRKDYPNLKPLS